MADRPGIMQYIMVGVHKLQGGLSELSYINWCMSICSSNWTVDSLPTFNEVLSTFSLCYSCDKYSRPCPAFCKAGDIKLSSDPDQLAIDISTSQL